MGHIHGFSSRMKLIIFFICIPLVHSELHRFMTTCTGINEKTAAGTRLQEFSAVTTLDDQQIEYYDSIIKKLIPRKYWMNKIASNKLYTEIREKLQQIYKLNIHDLMQEVNQSHGLHTYQRMYGCEWDDQTGDSQGFDQYAYDGEDFISLDLKELRYTNSVKEAVPTVMKWNNDKTQLEFLKHYFRQYCVDWLNKSLHLSKATLEKAVLFPDPPKVSLLEKKEGNYTCHVTGFLFRNTAISWRKNGQTMSDYSKLVKSGDTLPNEDGTFQRRLNLSVPPDEHKETLYTCVVEHKSLTEPIQKTMTVNKSSSSNALLIILVIILLIPLCALLKFKAPSKTSTIYIKNKAPPPGLALDPLISNPS